MQQIEFTVDNTALAAVKDIVIDANYEEMEAWLKETVTPYATMIVTEDSIADAKADRAKIRKARASIDDYRKSIEREYKKPVEDFKARVKPLLEICDSGIENLDSQVKAFEAAQKQAKIDGLRVYFEAAAGEAAEFVTFDQISNPKWENNGYSVEDAQKEIDEAISRTNQSVMMIRAIGNEFVPSLLIEYSKSHDLGAVLKMNQNLIARKEAEEKKKEEYARLRAEAEIAKQKKAACAAEIKPAAPAVNSDPVQDTAPEVRVVDFRVYATAEQLSALKVFLNTNGIRYGRVPV